MLPDWRENILYKATHVNHPSAIWCRESLKNYNWLESLFTELCLEYTTRYNRVHLCETKFADVFVFPPDNIDKNKPFTEPPQCMPDYCKVPGNTVQAYRNYYINEKSNFAVWKYSKIPYWYSTKEKTNV